jgi:hypothetical protein
VLDEQCWRYRYPSLESGEGVRLGNRTFHDAARNGNSYPETPFSRVKERSTCTPSRRTISIPPDASCVCTDPSTDVWNWSVPVTMRERLLRECTIIAVVVVEVLRLAFPDILQRLEVMKERVRPG